MLRVVLLMLWCLLYSGSLGAQEDLAFPTKLNFREFANSKVQQKIYLAAHQENIERLKAHLESVKKKWAENKLDDAMEKFRRGNIEKMRNQIAILEKTGPPVLPPVMNLASAKPSQIGELVFAHEKDRDSIEPVPRMTILKRINDNQAICRFIHDGYAETEQRYLIEGLDLNGAGKEFSLRKLVFERSTYSFETAKGEKQTIPRFAKIDFSLLALSSATLVH